MTEEIPRGERVGVDVETVRGLVADQFPAWAELPVRPVALSGWDNHTFRLGDAFKIRLPASAVYLPQLDKELTWLPRLATHLPYPVPEPVGRGRPGRGYPFPWSVWGWIEGEPALPERVGDGRALARDVARFLLALQACPAENGPAAGAHSFFRGGDLSVYAQETREYLGAVADLVDVAAVTEVWRRALSSRWERPPVWVHGDIAYGNLLVEGGELSAVIDFGTCAVGDPACDLVISWTLFDEPARAAFRAALAAAPGLDDATWDRARGWCVWKALLVLAQQRDDRAARERELAVISAACADAC